ncbi:MAG TPA: hypothetical protein VHF87_19745 [Methylomirabilota bacterium]|jgi:hypothetical protein|nr:hypothetical protein [Methylomirabilota bacterium]
MNPRIPTSYEEAGAWLQGFVRSHAKREDPRIEVLLDAAGPRDGRSYGVRLALDDRLHPPPGSPPMEFQFREVVEERTRFAWCAALGERVRTAARALLAVVPSPS